MSDDVHKYKRVINRLLTQLLEDIDPVALLDKFTECEMFTDVKIQDMREIKPSSEQKRHILKEVKAAGDANYKLFKQCLTASKQGHIVKYLEEMEKTLVTEASNSSECSDSIDTGGASGDTITPVKSGALQCQPVPVSATRQCQPVPVSATQHRQSDPVSATQLCQNDPVSTTQHRQSAPVSTAQHRQSDPVSATQLQGPATSASSSTVKPRSEVDGLLQSQMSEEHSVCEAYETILEEKSILGLANVLTKQEAMKLGIQLGGVDFTKYRQLEESIKDLVRLNHTVLILSLETAGNNYQEKFEKLERIVRKMGRVDIADSLLECVNVGDIFKLKY